MSSSAMGLGPAALQRTIQDIPHIAHNATHGARDPSCSIQLVEEEEEVSDNREIGQPLGDGLCDEIGRLNNQQEG
eukprot:3295041-Prymnesium_polylepis.1